MVQNFDAVILSAYGRSLGLACELQAAGLKTAYVDLTSVFRVWELADWEGPFGVFNSPDAMTELQRKVDECQAEKESLPRGFCVYDNEGVVEFQSPLNEFLLDRARRDRPEWLDILSQNLASIRWPESNDDIQRLSALPLNAPWASRFATAQRLNESLDLARNLGVTVFVDQLLDVSAHKGRLEHLQLTEAGLVQAEEFVWCLSQEDILRMPAGISSRIYPSGVLESDGCWLRYQFYWTLGTGVMRPPARLLVLSHRDLPWSHSNLLVLEDVPTLGAAQVWVRAPGHSRFLRSRLEEMADQIQTLLKERWPVTSLSLKQMPLEYEIPSLQLGAPRQPIFAAEDLARKPKPGARNWVELGPEAVGSLDLNHRWLKEREVGSGMIDRFKKRMQKTAKQEREAEA